MPMMQMPQGMTMMQGGGMMPPGGGMMLPGGPMIPHNIPRPPPPRPAMAANAAADGVGSIPGTTSVSGQSKMLFPSAAAAITAANTQVSIKYVFNSLSRYRYFFFSLLHNLLHSLS